MGLLVNALLVVGFAILTRAILDARRVSWRRLIVAALIGLLAGYVVGVLLTVESITVDTREDLVARGVYVVAFPFQLLVTMGAVVAFELMSSRPRTGYRLPRVGPVTAIRRRFAIARRGVEVLRVTARHGLRIGRGGDQTSATDRARRVRLAIEELGGVYVKLGQLLATRPDLVPPEVLDELARLQSSVTPLPFEEVRAAIAADSSDPDAAFRHIDPDPIGSASIAQVHRAELHDGTPVVVKVRRPGLEDDLDRDLAILDWVARTAERRSSAAARYGVRRVATEFADALRDELDFRIEAERLIEIADAVADYEAIVVPAPFVEHSTGGVLVMELLLGTPLSQVAGRTDTMPLAEQLFASQVRAMLAGDRFHGDPHAGNILLLTDGRLGLLDVGMTGRLDAFGREFVLELLVSLHLRDAVLLYEALLTGGSVDPAADRDQIERALAGFIAAHADDELSPEALSDLLRMASDLGLALPAQAAVMMRAMATLMGTLELLAPGYPLVDRLGQVAGVETRSMATPASLSELLEREVAALAPLAKRLPRHVDRIASQLERGQLRAGIRLFGDPGDRAVVEGLVNKVVLALVSLGVLAVSVVLIRTESGPALALADDLFLTEVLGWVGLFGATVLIMRALLDVLRPPGTGRP